MTIANSELVDKYELALIENNGIYDGSQEPDAEARGSAERNSNSANGRRKLNANHGTVPAPMTARPR